MTYPTILGAEALLLVVPVLVSCEKQAPICIEENRNSTFFPVMIASKSAASRIHASTLGTGVGNERWMEVARLARGRRLDRGEREGDKRRGSRVLCCGVRERIYYHLPHKTHYVKRVLKFKEDA